MDRKKIYLTNKMSEMIDSFRVKVFLHELFHIYGGSWDYGYIVQKGNDHPKGSFYHNLYKKPKSKKIIVLRPDKLIMNADTYAEYIIEDIFTHVKANRNKK